MERLTRDARRFRLAALEDKQHALLAGFEMLDLPDHVLDVALGGFGIQPGQPALMQLDFQGFQVDHGTSKVITRTVG